MDYRGPHSTYVDQSPLPKQESYQSSRRHIVLRVEIPPHSTWTGDLDSDQYDDL